MLWGGHEGGLEIRKRASGAVALRGRFPYGKTAVLSDGGRTGRPKKEIIAPNAFGFRVNDPKAEIHFLAGHSFDRPLASRGAGTLSLTDTAEALTFEATISPEMQDVSYVRDFLAGFSAGLVMGISPGFRLPPKRAVANPETITSEGSDPANGMHNAVIRTITSALLFEISAVTRPAYSEAQIEARNWHVPATAVQGTYGMARWRR
jgi:Escherichia/Staphylococcus phage prohead protease